MSLVKVSNSEDQVEMNNLEYLVWKDGWNGGQWNNWEVVNGPENYAFYSVSNDEIFKVDIVVKSVNGIDYDMGHRYNWTSDRVYVKDKGMFGEILIDSQSMSNGFKLMYTKK